MNAPIDFTGWMLWNIVFHYHDLTSASRPTGIFEDQPADVQTAWNRAADELQRRAKSLGRLV